MSVYVGSKVHGPKMSQCLMKMNACFQTELNGFIVWQIFLLIGHTPNVIEGHIL